MRHGTMAQSAAVRARSRAIAIGAAFAVALACVATPSRAAEAPWSAARVVWANGADLYVAAADSLLPAPGSIVRIYRSKRLLASGEVTRHLDAMLATVRLTSGALPPNARLDRFALRVEPPAPRRVATLRLGVPAHGRANLLLACARTRLDLGALPRAYAAETLATGDHRLVASDSLAGAWPDTIVVRPFVDASDEEIALERGELDAALFWPGEPSTRMRNGATGAGVVRGVRARGVLAIAEASGDTTAPATVETMSERMFGGDLLWLPFTRGGADPAPEAPRPRTGVRWSVDDALPGRRVLEAYLNRAAPRDPRPGERTPRLVLLDAPVSYDATSAVRPLFALRCAVFALPARAADLRRLDADALANLVACGAGASP